MLGSFQILDGGQPRRQPGWRLALLARRLPARGGARSSPGSWDVAGLRGTGSFDWTVDDVFLPERRTMVHAGVPLDNQWSAGRGSPTRLPAQAWVGPHHSAVITGIARAGIDALIELAGEKTPRGRTGSALRQPAGAGRGRPGRRDPQRRARLPQRDDHRAVEHDRGRRGDHAGAARPLPAGRRPTPPTARARRWTWCTGTAAARRSSARAAWPSAGATCTSSARRSRSRRSGTRSAAGRCLGMDTGPRLR